MAGLEAIEFMNLVWEEVEEEEAELLVEACEKRGVTLVWAKVAARKLDE